MQLNFKGKPFNITDPIVGIVKRDYANLDPDKNYKPLEIEPVSDHESGCLGKNENLLYVEIDKCNPA